MLVLYPVFSQMSNHYVKLNLGYFQCENSGFSAF